ncbi:MAG: alpha/beta hydrolase [Wenzhouxiangella sp.]
MSVLTRIVLLAALLYLGIAGAVFVFQSRLVFLPEVGGREWVATPERVGLQYQVVDLETEDGETLSAWWLPHPDGGPAVLFHHGNAGNISHRLESLALFHELGASVLIFDYRGYGQSSGRPTEQGLYLDARSAYRWLLDEAGQSADSIVLFGRSLGGAVAAQLATEVDACGLIVESTFSSIKAIAREYYWWLPVGRLGRLHFPTDQRLAVVEMPVLVIHSRDDEIVPFSHAERLLEAAGSRASLLEIQGDHNHGFMQSGRSYREGLAGFLDQCRVDVSPMPAISIHSIYQSLE